MGYLRPPSVWLRPGVAATATVAVAAAIGGFLTTVATPDGESVLRNIFCSKTSTGSGFCLREDGTGVFSGGLIVDGQTINTGSILTLSDNDDRYVNQSGDTMTGVLALKGPSLTISGAVLSATGSFRREVAFTLSDNATVSSSGLNLLQFKLRSFSGNLVGIHASSRFLGSGITIMPQFNGVNALSTALTIDEDETDSDTAATPAVIDTNSDNKAAGELIEIDVTACGGTKATGAKCPRGVSVNLIFDGVLPLTK